jgi:hypothetical protein
MAEDLNEEYDIVVVGTGEKLPLSAFSEASSS